MSLRFAHLLLLAMTKDSVTVFVNHLGQRNVSCLVEPGNCLAVHQNGTVISTTTCNAVIHNLDLSIAAWVCVGMVATLVLSCVVFWFLVLPALRKRDGYDLVESGF